MQWYCCKVGCYARQLRTKMEPKTDALTLVEHMQCPLLVFLLTVDKKGKRF